MLSDFWPHGAVAEKFGILRKEGYTERALFIIDKEGIIRYIDIHDIDQLPSTEELLSQVEKISGKKLPEEEKMGEQPALPHGGVVMYCTSWCPGCKQARAWLAKNEIKYTEVDIDKVPGASAQLREWTGGNLTTPTFDIDGKIIIEFNVAQLSKAIGL